MEDDLFPSSDEPFGPLPPERQVLLDRFKNYAVWHPRLVQVQSHVLDTIWEPADVLYTVVCGPSGVGKTTLAEGLTRRLNTPAQAESSQMKRQALLINTRPADGALFDRTDFYQKGLELLGKTTIDRHIQIDLAEARHQVSKKRPNQSRVPTYPDATG